MASELTASEVADAAQRELARWDVPAIEVAVVRDGDVVLADAFGRRDREGGLEATATTLFFHGSVAKSFTSALMATLVADGTMAWDRPVRDYLPGFRLADPMASERATMRDLLSHRTGLAQHDFVWLAHPDATPAELVRRVPHLDAGREFRSGFLYANLTYVAAGEAIAAATGSTWGEQLQRRILDPLGMDRTRWCMADALAADDRARPYGPRNGEVTEIAYRPVDSIAPAGGVVSCAVDMTRWLLAHTGMVEALPLDVLAETRTIHTPMPGFGGAMDEHVRVHGYGLGWVVGAYRRRDWLWHSGGIDGFWSHVAILPEIRAGIAVSANVTATQLPFALMLWLCDRLLELEPRPWFDELHPPSQPGAADSAPSPSPGAPADPANSPLRAATDDGASPPSRSLEAFAGGYEHPGYGRLVVEATGGELAVRLGEARFEAAHRHFDTWSLTYPAFPEFPLDITFHADAAGGIAEAWLPLEAAVAPIRFRRCPDQADSEDA